MPEPSLDRIREVVKLLDHPERSYPAIQITGTNGKTTTARLSGALACAQGLPTGTFVSPHVVSVTERLSLCADPIPEEEFGEEYERLLPYLELVDARVGPVTYFEALAALAFVWFADKPVGLGVFEVGMGGTWDATNLARGDVAVICPIGLDHVGILGSTVEEIAAEKAGIVKPGATAVVRDQRPEALEILRARTAEVDASMLLEGKDFEVVTRTPAVGGQALEIRGRYATYGDLLLPLFGPAAAANAAAAVTAVEALLGRPLDPDAVREAMASVRVPGRVEVMARRPLVVLDGAHNPDAADALVATLDESFHWERLLLVTAMFDDKDVEAVLERLAPLADRAFVARTSSARSAAPARAAAALRAARVPDVQAFESVAEAVTAALEAAGEDDLILVTGSFYTVADARPLFNGPGGQRSASTEKGLST